MCTFCCSGTFGLGAFFCAMFATILKGLALFWPLGVGGNRARGGRFPRNDFGVSVPPGVKGCRDDPSALSACLDGVTWGGRLPLCDCCGLGGWIGRFRAVGSNLRRCSLQFGNGPQNGCARSSPALELCLHNDRNARGSKGGARNVLLPEFPSLAEAWPGLGGVGGTGVSITHFNKSLMMVPKELISSFMASVFFDLSP